jgi:hypothetical protein
MFAQLKKDFPPIPSKKPKKPKKNPWLIGKFKLELKNETSKHRKS